MAARELPPGTRVSSQSRQEPPRSKGSDDVSRCHEAGETGARTGGRRARPWPGVSWSAGMPNPTVPFMIRRNGVFVMVVVATIVAAGVLPGASAAPRRERGTDPLPARVSAALQAGDSASLATLFPTDRKVRVSLDKIADLKGFVGAGPLVEALSRYLSEKSVHFDPEPVSREDASGPMRLRGVLTTRDKSGKTERLPLVFLFETIGSARLAVEVRETG